MSESPETSSLRALVGQLNRSQYAPAPMLAASQRRHLARLAAYCHTHSPQFAQRLRGVGLTPDDLADPAGLVRLPVLTRRELQQSAAAIYCREVPAGHGDVSEARTSGSTGEPVAVRRTALTRLFWHAMTMRDHQWHGRDLSGTLCAISPHVSARQAYADWGPPATVFTNTGGAFALPIAAAASDLLAWVIDADPTLLIGRPATLVALAALVEGNRSPLRRLRHIISMGETLRPDVRAAIETAFGARVADCYSSEEFGQIALQCPESGAYHVMAESVMAEVLNERGEPCGPGEIGRVTLTALHNYATPLIRYDIGDLVEVAPPCPCGRGLPAWARILGRDRSLIVMPDGTRHWPLTGFLHCRDVAPVRRYQFVQEGPTSIDARLVVERPLSPDEEERLRTLFRTWSGYPFDVRFTYVEDDNAVGPSAKREDFVSRL